MICTDLNIIIITVQTLFMNSEQSKYSAFKFEMMGFPATAIINQDLKSLESRFGYNHSVFIDIIPDSYNEDGHPEEKEFDYLIEVEKKIIDYLETQTKSVHVGHTAIYRKREIIFYTQEPEKVEGFLGYFLSTIERENGFEIEEDREWENVAAFYNEL